MNHICVTIQLLCYLPRFSSYPRPKMGLAARLQGQGLALLCPGRLEARALRSSGAVRARGVRSEVSVAGDIGALRIGFWGIL